MCVCVCVCVCVIIRRLISEIFTSILPREIIAEIQGGSLKGKAAAIRYSRFSAPLLRIYCLSEMGKCSINLSAHLPKIAITPKSILDPIGIIIGVHYAKWPRRRTEDNAKKAQCRARPITRAVCSLVRRAATLH